MIGIEYAINMKLRLPYPYGTLLYKKECFTVFPLGIFQELQITWLF